MKTLIDRLKIYKENIKLEDRFKYVFKTNANVFDDHEIKNLTDEQNVFKRNVKLKELIKKKANGSYEQTALNFWIINEWGGIQTFKKNEKNLEKINKFSNQLANSKMTIKNFDTIPSLSKISSFIDPDNYVIYDSRVIYAMNWLIMTTNQAELKFFPMPSARNPKLVDFDINTIIHLKYLNQYKAKNLFYDKRVAYFEFCNLIKTLSQKVFDDINAKPYILEMLLFTIADEEVYNELTKLTKVEIKPNC
jgi:hypothetical protein